MSQSHPALGFVHVFSNAAKQFYDEKRLGVSGVVVCTIIPFPEGVSRMIDGVEFDLYDSIEEISKDARLMNAFLESYMLMIQNVRTWPRAVMDTVSRCSVGDTHKNRLVSACGRLHSIDECVESFMSLYPSTVSDDANSDTTCIKDYPGLAQSSLSDEEKSVKLGLLKCSVNTSNATDNLGRLFFRVVAGYSKEMAVTACSKLLNTPRSARPRTIEELKYF